MGSGAGDGCEGNGWLARQTAILQSPIFYVCVNRRCSAQGPATSALAEQVHTSYANKCTGVPCFFFLPSSGIFRLLRVHLADIVCVQIVCRSPSATKLLLRYFGAGVVGGGAACTTPPRQRGGGKELALPFGSNVRHL